MLVQVLDHDDGGVDHGADGDGDPAQRQDVGVDALPVHDAESRQNADRQADQDDQRGAQMEQEQGADDDHDREFLDQLAAEIPHRPQDQIGAVVSGNDLHAFRQAAPQLVQPGFDAFNRGQGVFAGAHHDDAAHDFAFAVQFRRAAPQFWPQPDIGHVAEQDRGARGAHAQGNLPQVRHALQITVRAHHVLGLGQFEHRTADFLIGVLNRHPHLRERQVVGAHPVGIEHDLVLLDHAADRGHLGDAGQGLQFKFQEPVLQRAQLGQIVAAGAIHQGVFVNPADSGSVRSQRRLRLGRQTRRDLTEVFQHPRARPVQIRAIGEDHVDEGIAEAGIAAHRHRARHR